LLFNGARRSGGLSSGELGRTLDAFDFTVFLFLLVPIAREFNADLTLVVLVGSLTMWMRFVGAVAAGWMADRLERRAPLMISILGYSACNFIDGFSPTFLFLLVFRTLLGIGMGAEWPAGAALATESWPARSRGLMASVLQNQKLQKANKTEIKVPIAALFRRGVRLTALSSIQGAGAGAIYGINPSYSAERFPTEIRATAAAFCNHVVGALGGGLVPPVLACFAIERHMGFAIPMLIGTVGGLSSFAITLFFGPETKGKVMVPDLEILPLAEMP
jgi:MFS family permease